MTKAIRCAAACVLVAIASAQMLHAQDLTAPADGAGEPPALSDAELAAVLEAMTPEQIQEMIRLAVESRLEVERRQVAAELRQNLLYDPDEIEVAETLLNDSPANTQKDNIDRTFKAMAKVDARFGEALALVDAGKHAEAAEALALLQTPSEATYCSAARAYLLGDALAGAGKAWDALDVWADLMARMPDRISFAAAASARSARMYDDMNRGLYAMQMYMFCLRNYGLTLDRDEAFDMLARADRLAALYNDPMGSIAELMGEVRDSLDRADPGPQTRGKQDQIVSLLEDIIKTAEEKGGGGQKPNAGQKDRKPKECDCPGDTCTGQCKSAKSGKSANRPSSTMQDSVLAGGAVERPDKLSGIHDSDESGDWATMPPRQRERLQQITRQILSERHRDIISDYHSKLAEQAK